MLCSQVNDIETAESNYSNNEVAYDPLGPNSNSFTSWLIDSGYVESYFTAPPNTLGWNTRYMATFSNA